MSKSVMKIKHLRLTHGFKDSLKGNIRFTSRSIKKYPTNIYGSRMFVENTKHSDTLVEILSIADRSKCKIFGPESLRFLKNFYESSPTLLDYFRKAPKEVQRQYLATFDYTHDRKDVENLMKIAELTDYSSFLFKIGGKLKKFNQIKRDSCLIEISELCSSCTSSRVSKILTDANHLQQKLIYDESLRQDMTETLNKGIKPTSAKIMDRIHRYPIRELNDSDSSVALSTIYILIERFGFTLIEEIYEKFHETDRPLKLSEIIDLAFVWSEAKDYPLEWTLDSI